LIGSHDVGLAVGATENAGVRVEVGIAVGSAVESKLEGWSIATCSSTTAGWAQAAHATTARMVIERCIRLPSRGRPGFRVLIEQRAAEDHVRLIQQVLPAERILQILLKRLHARSKESDLIPVGVDQQQRVVADPVPRDVSDLQVEMWPGYARPIGITDQCDLLACLDLLIELEVGPGQQVSIE